MNLTPAAIEKLQDIMAQEQNPNVKLRVFVQGGGCSGFQYGFTLDEQRAEDDWDFEFEGVQVLVDSMSMQYLQGAAIDFQESIHGSNFSINNPNATTTCGCGSSFSV